MTHTPVAIIGSGPAGLTAAIYAARANLRPVMFTGLSIGGQLMTTSEVENFPGFPEGIQGPVLMQRMIAQAERFGTTLVYQNVTSVNFGKKPFTITADEEAYVADSVILAVGSTPRRLGIPAEEKYWGKGVSSCATCDGAFYKNQVVAVIGGGDSAMEEANFLTRFASKVYLVHRRNEFRASKIMQERVLQNSKIEVLWNSEVKDLIGDGVVQGMIVEDNKTQELQTVGIDGFFLAIGHTPQTSFLKGEIALDDHGYIVVHESVLTSKEGIFVAGDVADPYYQQAITAAGEGCKAALRVEKYLEEQYHPVA